MAVANRTIPSRRTIARAKEKAEPPPRAKIHVLPVLLVAAGAALTIGLLQVVQSSEATTTSFAIQRLEQEKLELEAGVSQLEAEVAGLSSITRVQLEAQRLGLRPAESKETIVVNVPAPDVAALVPAGVVPQDDQQGEEQDKPWWQDLLDSLPFN
jgi:cell division protein FtsL